ncbi:MAG: betaine/proline/choline family ABC transporter ATP-binding protein [Chloroflexi bacterium]|nr:betaine/proline/choline family ABC transporter ATP-binding protein [Chloroflexota bacterium]
MIELQNVTKIYPGQRQPAVAEVSFTVPEGKTCVLIGPSGCGKTTIMKMINRLIEPTEGAIFVDGQSARAMNPVQLRRTIGYVIQQIGLFPHMTIQQNIAVVPRLLGWKHAKIVQRADELIELVGMDPAIYRDRYPRELSGGQRQRIGVARALAADPPVMLMDEPFGAVDPITRDRLQNEFLRLQQQLHKTIVFVTHDIDEAIKMGDQIVILQIGGIIQQIGSPDEILAEPANDFVADFVGSDRGLKRLSLIRVGEAYQEHPSVQMTEATEVAIERMERREVRSLVVLDRERRVRGYITLDYAHSHNSGVVADIMKELQVYTETQATLRDAFSEMLSNTLKQLPVVDDEDHYLGVVTLDTVQAAIGTNGEEG